MVEGQGLLMIQITKISSDDRLFNDLCQKRADQVVLQTGPLDLWLQACPEHPQVCSHDQNY